MASVAADAGGGYPAWAGIDPMAEDKNEAAWRLPRVGGDRPE